MDLSITTRVGNVGSAVVHVEGEIDVHTGPELREALAELVRAGHHHLVVDLERVGFMDSTGIGVLIGALARLRPHGGSLRVVATQERILLVFRITGLSKVFPIHADVAEALTATGASGARAAGRLAPEGVADVLR